MKIHGIRIYRVAIPFRQTFGHASHVRGVSDNIVVETELENGIRGYGEGLPRPYVTGETQIEMILALLRLKPEVFKKDIHDLDALIAWIDEEILSQRNLSLDRENNTARCALEISFLDAFLKAWNLGFHDVAQKILNGSPYLRAHPSVRYDGVLSMDSTTKTIKSALKMKLYGFKKVKVKLGGQLEEVRSRMGLLRTILGSDFDIRVDANEAWTPEECEPFFKVLEDFKVSSVEQPVPHKQVARLASIRQKTQLPIMLDESLCSFADAERAIREKTADYFNLRLSKCGGFINTLRLFRYSRDHGIRCQLGSMVGETGILSSAGRHFATAVDELVGLEGSFDEHLLKDNITVPDVTFGYGGRAPALHGPGLGVVVDQEKLKTYAGDICQVF